ncbi:hypothetical protein [Alicyclobacillus vulcanalis]|uniref:Uncharacterized protein n=1 Tax=Alicyclobacillus vulcanalis TaxID=252246 RepID=A0A1N7MRW9_9BACL|nr:hypothetical protein [Alicyclobacillus vulcanalis]SIS88691.1 hypothetical protein SAMN05421799_10654 [Alicyclobacillus vulcanalis]
MAMRLTAGWNDDDRIKGIEAAKKELDAALAEWRLRERQYLDVEPGDWRVHDARLLRLQAAELRVKAARLEYAAAVDGVKERSCWGERGCFTGRTR